MLYLKWVEANSEGLGKLGISVLITKVDEVSGRVVKEIGLNEAGELVHWAPSDADNYGQFDNVRISWEGQEQLVTDVLATTDQLKDQMPAEEFEALWSRRLKKRQGPCQ